MSEPQYQQYLEGLERSLTVQASLLKELFENLDRLVPDEDIDSEEKLAILGEKIHDDLIVETLEKGDLESGSTDEELFGAPAIKAFVIGELFYQMTNGCGTKAVRDLLDL